MSASCLFFHKLNEVSDLSRQSYCWNCFSYCKRPQKLIVHVNCHLVPPPYVRVCTYVPPDLSASELFELSDPLRVSLAAPEMGRLRRRLVRSLNPAVPAVSSSLAGILSCPTVSPRSSSDDMIMPFFLGRIWINGMKEDGTFYLFFLYRSLGFSFLGKVKGSSITRGWLVASCILEEDVPQ